MDKGNLMSSQEALFQRRGSIAEDFFAMRDQTYVLEDDEEEKEDVRQLIEQSRKFYIGDWPHEFIPEENIFFLDKPMDKDHFKKLEGCRTCKVKLKANNLAYCEFCAYSSCKDCCRKTRLFPRENI